MHGSTGGDWKRSKELDHGRWGGTADRETGGTKAPGPTVRRSHRASPRPYSKDSGQPTFMIICGVDGWSPPRAR
jgi:hypothetical protein